MDGGSPESGPRQTPPPSPTEALGDLAREMLTPGGEQTPTLRIDPVASTATDALGTLRIDAGAQPTVPLPAAAPARRRVPPRLGPYVLQDELGHGGMGVVYRAVHEKLGTSCAVKVLIAGEHASPELIARFQREAAAVAKMGKHPHIVQVHDLGEEAGLVYYAMDLVEGKSLREVMKASQPTPRDAAALVEKAARALHFAHQHGIVHRDVKPENIVVRTDGDPQVMDFGLAHEAGSEQNLTVSGQLMGTLAYMAPEQARGEVASIDARTDVYALGGVLYDLLTGRPPHPGSIMGLVLPVILRGDILPPHRLRADLPRDLETIAMKALSLEPSRRYQTAEAMAEDLARWSRGESIVARPAGPARKAWLLVRRHKAASVATATVIAILSAVGASWYVTPGTLDLQVSPPDASVTIDGRRASAGATRLSAGGHVVEVSAPEHDPEVRDALIERRGTKEMRVELKHHTGTFAAECSAAESRIEVDGKVYGPRIPDMDLPTGRHHCVASAPGCFQKEQDVEVRSGERTSVYFWLDSGILWTQAAIGTSGGTNVCADVNGDGVSDLFQQELSRVVLYSGANGKELWSLAEGVSPATALRPVDLGGEVGRAFLLASAEQRTVRLIRIVPARGAQVAWTRRREDAGDPGGAILADATVDMTGDGLREVASCFEDGTVIFVDGKDGREVSRAALPVRCPAIRTVRGPAGERLVFGTRYCGNLPRERMPSPAGIGCLAEDQRSVAWFKGLETGVDTWLQLSRTHDQWVGWLASSGRWECLDAFTGKKLCGGEDKDAVALGHMIQGYDLDRDLLPDVIMPIGPERQAVFRGLDGGVMWHLASKLKWPPLETSDPTLVVAPQTAATVGLDAATGAIRWRIDGTPTDVKPLTLPGEGEMLFIGIQDQGIVCAGLDGRVRWTLRSDKNMAVQSVLENADGRGTTGLVVNLHSAMVGVVRVPQVLWERKAPEPLLATPGVLDTTGDGRMRVIEKGPWAATQDLLCVDGATGTVEWSSSKHSEPNRAPAFADFDGDGLPDVARQCDDVGSAGNRTALSVLSGRDGHELSHFPLEAPFGCVYALPAAADLDGDGSLDVATAEWDTHQVRAIDGRTGKCLWKYATGQPNMGGLGVADLDGDGRPDLVCPSIDGFVHAIRGCDGACLWKTEMGGSRSPPTLYDLTGDGTPEVLLVSVEGSLWVLDGRTGKALWNDVKGGEGLGRPAVAQLDRVGTVIVAPLGGAGVAAVTWPGKGLLWQGPKGKGVTASPVIADLDGDGKLEVVVGTLDGEMAVLDLARGTYLWGWKVADAIIEGDPAVADLDGDGVKDIVIASQAGTLTAISGRGTAGARLRRR